MQPWLCYDERVIMVPLFHCQPRRHSLATSQERPDGDGLRQRPPAYLPARLLGFWGIPLVIEKQNRGPLLITAASSLARCTKSEATLRSSAEASSHIWLSSPLAWLTPRQDQERIASAVARNVAVRMPFNAPAS